MRKFYIFFSFILLFHIRTEGQTALRGMYIDNFDQILGNTNKEDSLLQYAQDSSFNYLALYSLHHLNLSNSSTANSLGTFIYKARVIYGITYVGAVCETYNSFLTKITPFNLGRSDDNEKFNVFNLEFEFWTQSSVGSGGYYCTQYLQSANCNCDTSGGFKYYISELHKIDSLAATQNVLSETYLGWFNQGQAQQIHANVDRILLHAYRTGTSSLYSYSSTRLQYLASSNTVVDVAPIFSAEPTFMGPWLDSHSQADAYNQYKADFDNDNSSWKQYINILGHQWFDWGFMPKPVPGSGPTISSSGPLTFCSGGNVNLSATSGTNYLWSNGATSQSISVTNSGTYSCQVTSGGNTQSTPVVTVNVKESPTVSIAQLNPNSHPVTLNSSASSGSGTITGYQWLFNGNTLSGAQSTSLSAFQSGNYALTATNSLGCSKTSGIENVTVATACNPSVPTGQVAAPITELSFRLSWAQGQSGDSVLISYRPDTALASTYVTMANTQNYYVVSNLTTNTLYSWQVRMICGNSQGTNSSRNYFTTGNTPTSGIFEIPPGSNDAGNENSGLAVYPNPSSEALTIELTSTKAGKASVKIADINSRIVYEEAAVIAPGVNKAKINLTNFESGIYFLVVSDDNNVFSKKFIVSQ